MVFPIAIANLPIKVKMKPTPPVKAKVAECLRISKNPLIAAVQKLSPVRTT